MKVTGIHLKGHESVSDLSLSLKGSDGAISDVVALLGSSGSGKSLLIDAISSAWANSIAGGTRWDVKSDYLRIDFEVANEIYVSHLRGGSIDAHQSLKDAFSRDELVMKYDLSRLVGIPYWIGGHECSGVNAVYPMMSDIHTKGIRNSVVLIDDLDLVLGSDDVRRVFHYLRRHYVGSGNQLIFSCRSTDWISGSVQVVELGGGVDVIDRCMKRISSNK